MLGGCRRQGSGEERSSDDHMKREGKEAQRVTIGCPSYNPLLLTYTERDIHSSKKSPSGVKK